MQTLELRGLADPLAEAQWAMFAELADAAPDGADEVGNLMRAAREPAVQLAGLVLAGPA